MEIDVEDMGLRHMGRAGIPHNTGGAAELTSMRDLAATAEHFEAASAAAATAAEATMPSATAFEATASEDDVGTEGSDLWDFDLNCEQSMYTVHDILSDYREDACMHSDDVVNTEQSEEEAERSVKEDYIGKLDSEGVAYMEYGSSEGELSECSNRRRVGVG